MDSTRSVLPPAAAAGTAAASPAASGGPASADVAAAPETPNGSGAGGALGAPATAGGAPSAKALQRLARRAANMRARGLEPPESELRAAGLGPRACPGFPPGSFDFVMLDAPCSGLGLRPRLLMQVGGRREHGAWARAAGSGTGPVLHPSAALGFWGP
jgi:hypothetical protein